MKIYLLAAYSHLAQRVDFRNVFKISSLLDRPPRLSEVASVWPVESERRKLETNLERRREAGGGKDIRGGNSGGAWGSNGFASSSGSSICRLGCGCTNEGP